MQQVIDRFHYERSTKELPPLGNIGEFVVKPINLYKGKSYHPDIVEAKKVKVSGSIRRKICKVIKKCYILSDSIVLAGRFKLVLKNQGTPSEKAKLRFVTNGSNVCDKPYILHDTATLRATLIRLFSLQQRTIILDYSHTM